MFKSPEDSFSYKGDKKEAVVFAFIDEKGRYLIENRPSGPDHDGERSNFFPSGKIDKKDHVSGQDYRIVALKREISEEFDNKVIADNPEFLGEIPVDKIKIHFYVYLITNFSGKIPEYTIEDGKKFATLFWMEPSDQNNYFIFDTAFEISKMIQEALQQKSVLEAGKKVHHMGKSF